jgi:hypothetical protein
VGRRGPSSFKRNDGLRALKIARDGGIAPSMIEIVAKDGTVFRVYGDRAMSETAPTEVMTSAEWDEAIGREKAEGEEAEGKQMSRLVLKWTEC